MCKPRLTLSHSSSVPVSQLLQVSISASQPRSRLLGGALWGACNLTSFSPCFTGPVDYPLASRHKGPGFKSPGGSLCETGILLLVLSHYSTPALYCCPLSNFLPTFCSILLPLVQYYANLLFCTPAHGLIFSPPVLYCCPLPNFLPTFCSILLPLVQCSADLLFYTAAPCSIFCQPPVLYCCPFSIIMPTSCSILLPLVQYSAGLLLYTAPLVQLKI
jgi:hypothetical protein